MLKQILLFLFCVSTLQALGQQAAPISIRENWFNNYRYERKGEPIRTSEVKTMMADYPETLRKFETGSRNMALGKGLKTATVVVLTSGMIYLLADDFSTQSLNVFIGTTVFGLVMGIVAPGIFEEGKDNVSQAIQEYNYQILRNPDFLLKPTSFEARNPFALGWTFRF